MSSEQSSGDLSAPDRKLQRDQDALLAALIERNPNALARAHLHRLLPNLADSEIDSAAEALATRGLIQISDRENKWVPGRVNRVYELTDPTRYPIRETLVVGNVEIHRAIQGDINDAEDVNAFFEVLSEYNATVEERVRDLTTDLTRRYWFNIAALLGLFVGVFGLITKGTELVTTAPHGSAMDLFWRNLAALGPLAGILFLFVGLLVLALRRK